MSFIAGMLAGAVAAAEVPATKPATAFTVSKALTRVTEPLLADGRPDYVGAMNAKHGEGATRENNGFVIWLEVAGNNALADRTRDRVLEMLGVKSEPLATPAFISFEAFAEKWLQGSSDEDRASKEFASLADHPWKAEGHPLAATYLERATRFLDRAQEAAARPKWYAPYVGPSVASTALPSLGPCRSMVRAWCARGMLRLEKGDFDGFMKDMTAAAQLARHMAGGATIIEAEIGYAMEGRVQATLGAALATGRFSAEQCDAVGKTIDQLAPLPTPAEGIETNRWMILEETELYALGTLTTLGPFDGPDGRQIGVVNIRREDVDWDVVLGKVNVEMDKVAVACSDTDPRKGYDASQSISKDLDARAKSLETMLPARGRPSRMLYTQFISETIVCVLIPDTDIFRQQYQKVVIRADLLKALLAAAKYRADKGAWPQALDELKPKYLADIPCDRFSPQQPVRYVLLQGGPRVYSVGMNGKDDTGMNDNARDLDDISAGMMDTWTKVP